MRYLILLLIFLNIMYFLLPKDPQETMHSYTRGSSNTSLLVTLDEKDNPPSPLTVVPASFTLASTEMPSDQDSAEAVQVASVDDDVTDQAAEVDADEPPEEPEDVKPEVSDASEALDAIEDQGKFDKASEKRGGLGITATEPPQTIVRGPLKCYTLGPFKDKETINEFTANMIKKGVKPEIRTAKARRASGYWVYLPSYSSREKADAVADHLASIGFTDYLVVRDAKRKHAISLGLFSRKEGSQQRVRDLKEMGYKAKVETRFSDYDVYWVDYESYSEINWTPLIKEYVPSGDVENLDRECE